MKIIKDYEKAAIAIGVGALGLAAYQAHKTKQAADAVETTDPARNPVTAAIELSKNLVGGTASWFRQRYDDATGYTKGKAANVVDTIKAVPSSIFYWTTKAKDFGEDATQSGSKYIWSAIGQQARYVKQKLNPLGNKPFTLMGGWVERLRISRPTPRSSQPMSDSRTGAGSNTEVTERTTKEKIQSIMRGGFGLSGFDRLNKR